MLALVALLAVAFGHHTKGSFAHITDIHLDLFYRAGQSVEHFCHPSKKNPSPHCKPFGAQGHSDAPQVLVDVTAQVLTSFGDLDFIVYTGDTDRHGWDKDLPITSTEHWETIKDVVALISAAKPSTPVIPSIGNNDVWPHDLLSGGPNTVLDNITLAFAPWLSASSQATFRQGGYCAVPIPGSGMTVVSMNTMYWASFNTAVPDCSAGPGADHFDWLESTLTELQKDGQKALLIGHVPPSGGYKKACLDRYEKLTAAFQSVITGHLFGHLHDDEFDLIVSEDEVVGVAFVAPAVIPQFNPAWRLFRYDRANGTDPGTLLDFQQFYGDLDKANKDGIMKPELEYSALDAYSSHLADMSVKSWAELKQWIHDHPKGSMAEKYAKYKKVST